MRKTCVLFTIFFVLLLTIHNADADEAIILPEDAAAYADEIESYSPGSNITDPAYKDSSKALGEPDYPGPDQLPVSFVSLGKNGSLTVKFTDNALTTSGNSDYDLYICEVGLIEPAAIQISMDNANWISVGNIDGAISGIDIDAFTAGGVSLWTKYKYVKITDLGSDKSDSKPYPGADIDAVAALSSTPPNPNNIAPSADAGADKSFIINSEVTLDGSNSSDPDGSIVSYIWEQLTGTAVTLSNSDTASPSFTAPGITGALSFSLTVVDNLGLSGSDTCIINITASSDDGTGSGPNAAATPKEQTVAEGVTVVLNGGTSSTSNGVITSYSWRQISGPDVTISTPDSREISFTAPEVGIAGDSLTFELTVTDSAGMQNTDSCIVNVSNVNKAPKANAGLDRNASPGELVTLNGSNSSDPDEGDAIASWLWSVDSGISVILSEPTSARPSFTVPETGQSGSITFRLTVTDNGGLKSSDTCIVNISSNANTPPRADAGESQTVTENQTITLDASGSVDSENNITAYLWEQTSGPSVTLSDPRSATPVFTAPETDSGGNVVEFCLTVTDSEGLTDTDNCHINITEIGGNQPPEADAGESRTVTEGVTVTLDGSASTDDNGVSSYLWIQTDGAEVTLSDITAAKPTFVTPPVAEGGGTEIVTFMLSVADSSGLKNINRAEVTITIEDNGIIRFPENALTFFSNTGREMGISVEDDCPITKLEFLDPDEISGTNKPGNLIYGLLDFEIKTDTPGDTITVTIYLPEVPPAEYGWYKYDSEKGWSKFENAVITENRVTLTLKDGGEGDDNDSENGIISDPSGLGTAPAASGSGGGGGGCFISAIF